MEDKTINCSVHGAMTFSHVAVAIIDTLEFQRLRYISQVGATQLVYPSATHSRFEHSLGTAYMAKLFISEIKSRQPELNISEREILCVELAGLCHDLGHGPFSHLWERFYREGGKESQKIDNLQWHHEQTSVHILRLLLKRNRILERFPAKICEADVSVIADLILGNVPNGTRRRFLYQIVNNGDSGLDVDKWDYFMRDAQNLGIPIDFQYRHVLRNLKVLQYENELHVCFRDKCYESIQQGFENRFKLHKRAYQHHKVKIMDEMILQALIELARVSEPEFKPWAITHAIACDNPTDSALSGFLEMTDDEINMRLRKHSPTYKTMLQRSADNGMYRFVGTLKYGAEVRDKFLKTLTRYDLKEADVALLETYIHMGKGEDNPMNQVLFFRKGSTEPKHISSNTPLLTSERSYVVALKCSDSTMKEHLMRAIDDFHANEGHNEVRT